jgi:DNA-binding SARP family transcriptional activator
MIETVGADPAPLAIRLLGRVDIRIVGRPVALGGRHAQALIALLALEPRKRTREAIALDLWPDSGSASTASLRQALWMVRAGFVAADVAPESVLDIEPESIGLRRPDQLDLDVRRFEGALAGQAPDLAAAVELYAGELAESLGHECFAAERERLAIRYEDALARLAAVRLQVGDLVGARDAAVRLIGRDPLREEAHAVLLEVYGATGSRSQVFGHYRRLEDVLRRELDVEPLPETTAAFRRALATAVDRSARRVAEAVFANPPPGGLAAAN